MMMAFLPRLLEQVAEGGRAEEARLAEQELDSLKLRAFNAESALSEEQNKVATLIEVFAAVKDGRMSLDQITVEGSSITIQPPTSD